MLLSSYNELDAATKISLMEVVNNHTLYQLIDAEIELAKESLISCTPNVGMEIQYAVIQQRLISLQDLKNFLKIVREETTPQPHTE